jgi:hypothetical protein
MRKAVPFTIALKTPRNKTVKVKDLYNENYKTLKMK